MCSRGRKQTFFVRKGGMWQTLTNCSPNNFPFGLKHRANLHFSAILAILAMTALQLMWYTDQMSKIHWRTVKSQGYGRAIGGRRLSLGHCLKDSHSTRDLCVKLFMSKNKLLLFNSTYFIGVTKINPSWLTHNDFIWIQS